MNLILAFVAQRSRSDLFDPALQTYLDRLRSYIAIETAAFQTEQALFASIMRQRTRTAPWLVLLDSRGQEFSSEEFSGWLAARRDSGQQTMVFAIGPASGWSEQSLEQARTLLSLGPMTLPHELARLVVAEQIYRAFTILAGHPYHTGH